MSIIKVNKYRRIFGLVFIVSLFLTILLAVGAYTFGGSEQAARTSESSAHEKMVLGGIDLLVIGFILSTFTSFTGFILTALIAWRKEKRESKNAEVELKKRELEIEKLSVEIEKLKNKSQ